jgi:uncharacterized protein
MLIEREGSLSRVQPAFAPVVEAARQRIAQAFGGGGDGGRLHSAYLYGSVPRGTARPGVSDLDLLLALRTEPTAGDRAEAEALEAGLDADFEQIDGVGALLLSAETLLSELERYDLGWFVACLCTPLLGEDLGGRLPPYGTTSLLARETNGDLGLWLPRWRERAAAATTDAERRALCRVVARKVVRTGFTLVMPRYGAWTSELAESADAFGGCYPERAEQMRAVARVARTPSADGVALGVLAEVLEDLGPWLAAEYAAVHGVKAPRPGAS